jgi:hypothetical protein
MPKGPFLPSEFQPTKFSTAQDKADFGNAFFHFIESEWVRTAFTKSYYIRLSMCFSHIAHYDAAGFYETWFTSDPTGCTSCVTRSRGRAGAIRSSHSAMLSAPSSKRFGGGTILLDMS